MTPIQDAVIEHAIAVLRYSASERASVRELLAKLERDLATLVSEANVSGERAAKIKSLIAEARAVIAEVYGRERDDLAVHLAELVEIESRFTARVLAELPVGGEPQLADARTLKLLATDTLIQGAPSAEWWSRQAGDTLFRFTAAVREGVAWGRTNGEIVTEVRRAMDVSRRNAEALVRSSVQTVANAARLETFRANPDIITAIKQVSTLDDRTSDVCIAYDGQTWDLDGNPVGETTLPFNGGPPRHWNCRSTLVPITKTFKDLGIDLPEMNLGARASAGGPVASGTTFAAWLARQPEATADALLGKGRAAMWRNGRITLQQLLSFDGHPLTLEELRRQFGGQSAGRGAHAGRVH